MPPKMPSEAIVFKSPFFVIRGTFYEGWPEIRSF